MTDKEKKAFKNFDVEKICILKNYCNVYSILGMKYFFLGKNKKIIKNLTPKGKGAGKMCENLKEFRNIDW